MSFILGIQVFVSVYQLETPIEKNAWNLAYNPNIFSKLLKYEMDKL